jgi:peptide/nickel transport system permease protein
MQKKLLYIAGEILLITAGIIFISATSVLFESQSLSVNAYFKQIGEVLSNLISPADLVYVNPISDIERNLFPILLLAFWSSARIFFLSLALALIVSIILLIIYFSFNRFLKAGLTSLSFLFGSLPDIFIIILAQMSIVWFFKNTGILLIDLASVGQNQVILLPAITLSVLPAFFFFNNMVQFLREEEGNRMLTLREVRDLPNSESYLSI